MALSTDKKLYIALGILAAMGGALYLQQQKQSEESKQYSFSAKNQDLPKIEINDEQINKITRVTIQRPADDDAGAPELLEFTKEGEDWKFSKPIDAAVTKSTMKGLLDGLKSLKVTERIDPSKEAYAKYGLDGDKPVHASFYAGDKLAHEFYFGKGGSRGQTLRFPGQEGVYAVKGYSSFVYERKVKLWRDLSLSKFDEKEAVKVEINNENGSFIFEAKPAKEKADDKDKDAGAAEAKVVWSGKHAGPKGGAPRPIAKFDSKKVDDLVRAYKSLTATDFSRDKKPGDVKLAEPLATITISLKDGAKRTLQVGDTAEGTSRWVRRPDDTELFVISSWAADWAVAELEKFQESEETPEVPSSPPPAGPPPGLPPGLPPGHP